MGCRKPSLSSKMRNAYSGVRDSAQSTLKSAGEPQRWVENAGHIRFY